MKAVQVLPKPKLRLAAADEVLGQTSCAGIAASTVPCDVLRESTTTQKGEIRDGGYTFPMALKVFPAFIFDFAHGHPVAGACVDMAVVA